MAVSSQRHWQRCATPPERENLNQQIERLAHEVTKESDELIPRFPRLYHLNLQMPRDRDNRAHDGKIARIGDLGCAVGQGSGPAIACSSAMLPVSESAPARVGESRTHRA